MMTAKQVADSVEKIRKMAGDDELAHGAEDTLYVEVLQAMTQELNFSRWCA